MYQSASVRGHGCDKVVALLMSLLGSDMVALSDRSQLELARRNNALSGQSTASDAIDS